MKGPRDTRYFLQLLQRRADLADRLGLAAEALAVASEEVMVRRELTSSDAEHAESLPPAISTLVSVIDRQARDE